MTRETKNPVQRLPRRQAGVTLLQVMIAVPLIVVVLFGLAAVLAGASRRQSSTRATAIAVAALREKVGEIQHLANTDMASVYDAFTNVASSTFAVPGVPGVRQGLQPLPGNAFVGTILCWNDETGARMPAGALAGDSARLGLPRDLNMDDDAGDENLLGFDMKVVPMKITLDFMDASGPRHMEIFYMAASQPQ